MLLSNNMRRKRWSNSNPTLAWKALKSIFSRIFPKQAILSYYISSWHFAGDPCTTYLFAIGINMQIFPCTYLLNALSIYSCLLQKQNWIFRLLNPPRQRHLQKQLPFLFQAPPKNHTYGPCIPSLFHTKHNIYAAQRQ